MNSLNSVTIKVISVWLILISVCLALTSCSPQQLVHSNQSQEIYIGSANSSISNSELTSDKADDQNQYYKVYTGKGIVDRLYYYYDLFDKSGNMIRHECTYMNEPHVSMISGNIVKVWVQTGTGMATRWVYYYNVKTGAISQSHLYPLTEKLNLIAYFDTSKIIVCDMFNEEKFYKEISLTEELSNSCESVKAAAFSDDLKQITVTYVSGPNSEEKSETINLS